ncbi:unnamed protein product [Prorocentrum cordatum]|uniref:Uncharacterized protein n=1 Tax=Prorocentrum cordatum TaxID=2364126 RepID=A0ABN9V104_9DINO|nr:unnamed protein product [Polarella glacialis]
MGQHAVFTILVTPSVTSSRSARAAPRCTPAYPTGGGRPVTAAPANEGGEAAVGCPAPRAFACGAAGNGGQRVGVRVRPLVRLWDGRDAVGHLLAGALLLADRRWERVVTHGALGEYGHPWGTQVTASKARAEAIAAYASQRHILHLYSEWSSLAVPVEQFDVPRAGACCARGAGSIPYYGATCAAGAQGHAHAAGLALAWESHAYSLQDDQDLARELARTVDVDLYGLPLLRRFLYGPAAVAAAPAQAVHACSLGTAAALAWAALAPNGSRVTVLPLAATAGRLLEDATILPLQGSRLASRVAIFDGHRAADLAGCDCLLGRAEPLLEMLQHEEARRARRSWRLAVHGDLGGGVLGPGGGGAAAGGRAVEARLRRVLRGGGWRVSSPGGCETEQRLRAQLGMEHRVFFERLAAAQRGGGRALRVPAGGGARRRRGLTW